MTKIVTVVAALILFSPLSSYAQAGRCINFLQNASAFNASKTQTYTDPGLRFSVERTQTQPLLEQPVRLTEVTRQTALEVYKTESTALASVLQSLNIQNPMYSLNTPVLMGYLKSLTQSSLTEGRSVQFLFWEGTGAKVDVHSSIQGTLTRFQTVPARSVGAHRVESFDHYVLTISESLASGEKTSTIVKIPVFLTSQNYRTLSLPGESAAGYHWGLLLGTQAL